MSGDTHGGRVSGLCDTDHGFLSKLFVFSTGPLRPISFFSLRHIRRPLRLREHMLTIFRQP